jgi:hypothetical protein
MKRRARGLLFCTLGCLWHPLAALPQAAAGAGKVGAQHAAAQRDGQHDFDFNIGTWKTHVTRLVHPLSGAAVWAQYDGTSVVRPVWKGRASLFELEVNGPAGHIEGVGLRLYNPRSRQWSLNWANGSDGTLNPPMIGAFKDGRGEFFDQEQFNGRAILARNSFSDITPSASRFEQAFSDDGGKTWETNWIMTFTRAPAPAKQPQRVKAQRTAVPSAPVLHHAATARDRQPDFDFDIGAWKVHISRLERPLTGSVKWTVLDGTVVVRKVWDGRANLAEVEADGPTGHLEILSLRLYDPRARQWSLNFATSSGGVMAVPMVGELKNGRGEFVDQEQFNGRTILVRFVISPVTADSVRSEQAFSDDGGKTWEVNWINTYTRMKDGTDKMR